jgi:hypothetical protein
VSPAVRGSIRGHRTAKPWHGHRGRGEPSRTFPAPSADPAGPAGAVPGNPLCGRPARLYPGGWRCERHSPPAERARGQSQPTRPARSGQRHHQPAAANPRRTTGAATDWSDDDPKHEKPAAYLVG